jgi:hypothetical protein
MTIWCMRCVRCTTKVTDTHLEYVILGAFPQNSGFANVTFICKLPVFLFDRCQVGNLVRTWIILRGLCGFSQFIHANVRMS